MRGTKKCKQLRCMFYGAQRKLKKKKKALSFSFSCHIYLFKQ